MSTLDAMDGLLFNSKGCKGSHGGGADVLQGTYESQILFSPNILKCSISKSMYLSIMQR